MMRQTGVRRQLAAIVEVAEERLQPKAGGKLRPDPLDLEQHPPRRLWGGGLLLGEQRVPLGLRRLDLIQQQFEPIKFATDLGFEMRRQGTAVPLRKCAAA
jgi:hypothetical protein